MRITVPSLLLTLLISMPQLVAADSPLGMKTGNPELKSISSMTFGPSGILFIGDALGARLFAFETGDRNEIGSGPLPIVGLNRKLAEQIHCEPAQLRITDLAVNHETGHLFLAAVVDGQSPRLFQVTGAQLRELDLPNARFSQVALPNPVEDKETGEGRRRKNNRPQAITDLSYLEGRLLVAGLSNAQGATTVWSVPFPFDEVDAGTPVEFYHGAHGRVEDHPPIRTFVPFVINGEPNLLAGFVCTPLVRFPLKQLENTAPVHERVKGTTVAELGNHNQPLDLIHYQRNGKDFLLLSNSARGVMKISTEGLDDNPGLTQHVPDGGTAGQSFTPVPDLQGTVELGKLNDSQAVVLQQQGAGELDLRIVDLP
jgi:hypothetical protein